MSYTRNTTTGAARVLDNNKYYAFGMNHLNQMSGSLYHPLSVPYNYKHSGKELQETGTYDFGWRHYMPDIGRWNGMDQLSEMYAPISPYSYVANNPISFTDPDGRKIKKNGEGSWTFDGADLNMILAYLTNDGDFGDLVSKLESFGDDFGSGPLSDFWGTFDSGGVLGGAKIENGNVVWTQHIYLEGNYVGSEIVSQAIYSIYQEVKKAESDGLNPEGGNYFDKMMWGAGAYDLVHNHKTYKTTRGVVKEIYKANGQPRSRRAARFAKISKLSKGLGVVGFGLGVFTDGIGVVNGTTSWGKAGVNTTMGALGFTAWGTPASLLYGTAEAFHPQGAEGALSDYGEAQNIYRQHNGGAVFKAGL